MMSGSTRVSRAKYAVLDRTRDIVGESPFFDAASRTFFWVDMVGKKIRRRSLNDGEVKSVGCPTFPVAIALRHRKPGLAIALADGVYLFDFNTAQFDRIAKPDGIEGNRLNEGKCDSKGRFWVSSMQNNVAADGSPQPIERSTGALFCVQHNGNVSRHTPFNIGASNTMAWSPDNRTFYFADSLRNVIFAYPWDGEAGTIGEPRVFLEGFDRGIPDGSCIDSAGCLWNARWGGGCMVRITPRGQIDRVLEVPVTQPTNCAFAADGTLIVTSARFALSPDVVAGNPLEGAVLLVESNAQGLPENTFGG